MTVKTTLFLSRLHCTKLYFIFLFSPFFLRIFFCPVSEGEKSRGGGSDGSCNIIFHCCCFVEGRLSATVPIKSGRHPTTLQLQFCDKLNSIRKMHLVSKILVGSSSVTSAKTEKSIGLFLNVYSKILLLVGGDVDCCVSILDQCRER